LQGRFYTGQTGAYVPFATAMDTSATLERLAERPLTLGTEIGARTTAGTAAGGRFLSEGITSAAQTMAPANRYSGTGNALTGFADNPLVARGLENIFGSTPNPPAQVRNIYTGELGDATSVPTPVRRDPVTGQYIPVR